MDVAWLLIPVGYVLGMIQSAEVVGRFVGRDPRREGSRNPGASNMYRLAGQKAGAIVLILDVLKGVVAAGLGLLVDGTGLGLAAGAAAMVGHIFPAIRGFRGGKGVATFGGVSVTLWPIAGLIGLAIWLLLLKVTARASVASLAGVAATVIALAIMGQPGWAIAGTAALGVLILIRHRSNIERLIRGEEATVG